MHVRRASFYCGFLTGTGVLLCSKTGWSNPSVCHSFGVVATCARPTASEQAALLALCTACGDTAKLTVLERMNVRSVRPELLDRLHANDPGLTAELLQDPLVRRRNRIALDWEGAWRLDTGGSDHLDREVIDVSVRFAARIPVRPVRLIAEGCGLSRAEVDRLITEGKVVSTARLSGKLSGDFTFMLKR